jgi:hypothetical protein
MDSNWILWGTWFMAGLLLVLAFYMERTHREQMEHFEGALADYIEYRMSVTPIIAAVEDWHEQFSTMSGGMLTEVERNLVDVWDVYVEQSAANAEEAEHEDAEWF